MIRKNLDEFKRRLKILPSAMDIYVTNACNMRCKYCASGALIGNRNVKTLSRVQMTKAIDLFASYVNPALCAEIGGDPAYLREISFTGGEPLLRFNLIQFAVKYIRKKYPWFKMVIFSNGLLLDKKVADFLLKNNVKVIVSLDGIKRANDYERKTISGDSAFEIIMDNFKKLGPNRVKQLHIMATFTAKTVGNLVESVKFFKTLHCKDIHLGLDLYEMWEDEKLKSLKTALSDFKVYYMRDCSNFINFTKNWNFNFYFKDKVSASQDLTPSNSFTLSWEGVFYPCDELCVSNASQKIYGIGNLDEGINFRKMEKTYRHVKEYVQKYDKINGVNSPIDRYFYSVLRGKNTESYLRNSGKITKIFLAEFSVFVEIERLCKKMAHDTEFGDFLHRPEYISNKEMKFLKLAINKRVGNASDTSLAKIRNLADYFFYSRGIDKYLVIKCSAGKKYFDIAKAISLYLMFKSKYLGKTVKISFEFGGQNLSRFDSQFLRDNKISIVTK